MTLLEMALIKLGLCPLMLSVNNSAAAIANLCKITKTTTLLYGAKFRETVLEAQEILANEDVKLELEEEKRYPLWGKGGVDDVEIKPYKARLTPEQESPRTALILHSSGSVSPLDRQMEGSQRCLEQQLIPSILDWFPQTELLHTSLYGEAWLLLLLIDRL